MLKPNIGKLLVKKIKTEKANKVGGLIIPENEDKKSIIAAVIAVGQCEKDEKFAFKPGQVVFLPKWAGNEVSLDPMGQDEYLIVNMKEVLGVKENE